MIPILLLITGALQQPQPVRRPTPSQAAAAHQPVPTSTQPTPHSPVEATVAAISEIGIKVAELRSVYDLYRRAAFNDPDGALLERATMYQATCRDLAEAAARATTVVCRSCLARKIQVPVDQYRAYLPSLHGLGQVCATRVTQLKAHGDAAAQSKALRDDVQAAGVRMVSVLRGYEARLQPVRVAMNWDSPPMPAPRRGN